MGLPEYTALCAVGDSNDYGVRPRSVPAISELQLTAMFLKSILGTHSAHLLASHFFFSS